MILITDDLIQLIQHFVTFDNLSEDTVTGIQVVQIVLQSEEELRPEHVCAGADHGNQPLLGVFDFGDFVAFKIGGLIAIQALKEMTMSYVIN